MKSALIPSAMLLALCSAACGPAVTNSEPAWPENAKKWFDRAQQSYRTGDVEDAESAVGNALRVLPEAPEVRILAARIALARLDYERTTQLLNGVEGSDASSVRGRAYWYAGQIDKAADELEKLVADPEVRDPWAAEVAKLARRGAGRKPFKMSGGMVAVMEMPQVASTSLVVPVEVNGEPALGLIATGTAEAVVDSGGPAGDPKWISLRFGERIDVKDVPALSKDLSGISKQLNAPIKVLIGVNLLRHLHPTVDFAGSQFVVRSFEPPPPPQATTVKVSYVRGGGMMMRGAFGSDAASPGAALLIDTSMTFPLALDEGGWKKAGVQTSALRSIPNAGSLRAGVLPQLRLGAFTVPQVPGVLGAPVAELEKGLDVDLDGLVGSGLLATFRVTLVDGGRTMWLEDLPPEALMPAPKLPDLPDPGDVPDDEPEDEPAPAKPGAPKPPLGKPPAPPAPGAKPTGVAPKPPVAPPPMPPPAPKAGGNAPPATPKGTAP
ncbi:MAG: hypothetical protein U0263_21600 [Polyangiaceae bacterium]